MQNKRKNRADSLPIFSASRSLRTGWGSLPPRLCMLTHSYLILQPLLPFPFSLFPFRFSSNPLLPILPFRATCWLQQTAVTHLKDHTNVSAWQLRKPCYMTSAHTSGRLGRHSDKKTTNGTPIVNKSSDLCVSY